MKKRIKNKNKIVIIRIKTKLDTKIKWSKILGDKINKKSTSKSRKNKTNSNQKNEDQNWYKYKLTRHVWFLKGLAWNLRRGERGGRKRKILAAFDR